LANIENKYPENVNGSYYVDDQCIACEVCPDEAEDNFKMNDDNSHAFVYKQPEDNAEEEECASALAACPVDAIGDDG